MDKRIPYSYRTYPAADCTGLARNICLLATATTYFGMCANSSAGAPDFERIQQSAPGGSAYTYVGLTVTATVKYSF